jgi:hypothetical protein
MLTGVSPLAFDVLLLGPHPATRPATSTAAEARAPAVRRDETQLDLGCR